MISFVKAFMGRTVSKKMHEPHVVISVSSLRNILEAAVDEGRLIERLEIPHTGVGYKLTGNTISASSANSGRLEVELGFSIEFPTDNDAMIYKLSKETKDDQ